MRIYLDACCFNRPFDDPSIDRNRLEAEAVISILSHVERGEWVMIGSNVLEFELGQSSNRERRLAVLNMLAARTESLQVGVAGYNRAQEVTKFGFKPLDALHLACAEIAICDVFLTTDDGILKKAAKWQRQLNVEVRNPLDWLLEQHT